MRTIFASLCCLLFVSGCGGGLQIPWFSKQPKIRSASPAHPVNEIVTIWEAAEGTGLNGLPARGFAGQVMFFARGLAEPVSVDGEVRVFLFENEGALEQQAKPIHQFDFGPKAWETHLHLGTLGATYSLFIPYTKMDNPYATRCSLRVRLTPPNGQPVYSNAVAVTLPGPERDDHARATSAVKEGGTMTQLSLPLRPARPSRPTEISRAGYESTAAESHRPAAELSADRIAELMQEQAANRTAIPDTAGEPPAPTGLEPRRFRLAPSPASPAQQERPTEPARHGFTRDFQPLRNSQAAHPLSDPS